jgi:hypothetical protein
MSQAAHQGSGGQSQLKKYERPVLLSFGTVQELTSATSTDGTSRRQFLRHATITAVSLAALTTFACDGVS